jgi:hypothetical protein
MKAQTSRHFYNKNIINFMNASHNEDAVYESQL